MTVLLRFLLNSLRVREGEVGVLLIELKNKVFFFYRHQVRTWNSVLWMWIAKFFVPILFSNKKKKIFLQCPPQLSPCNEA